MGPKANLFGGPCPFVKGIYPGAGGGGKGEPESCVLFFHELPLFSDGFP